jgi:hypothetical protein
MLEFPMNRSVRVSQVSLVEEMNQNECLVLLEERHVDEVQCGSVELLINKLPW